MSEAGKGDANTRVKDWRRFWANYEKIYGSNPRPKQENDPKNEPKPPSDYGVNKEWWEDKI